MFGRLLERFIRKRAQTIVRGMIEVRKKLEHSGASLTPRAVLKEYAGDDYSKLEDLLCSGRPSAETLKACMASYEGVAYWIEMEGGQELGRLLNQRWWKFCQYVDDFIQDAGFPIQSKEVKESLFQALKLNTGNYKRYL